MMNSSAGLEEHDMHLVFNSRLDQILRYTLF